MPFSPSGANALMSAIQPASTTARTRLPGKAAAIASILPNTPSPPAELPAITLCAASAGLVAYLPLSLNGIGTVELTGLTLFGALGLPPEKILAAYLWLRVATLAATFVPLLVLLLPMRRPHPPSR